MIEKRKKELEKLEKDKDISVTYKPNGKKVYYKLTEDLFFNSSISEKLISNQQIKEWALIQVDNFLQHIEIGDSELIFHKINYLRIQYSKGKITRAGSYIQTPKILKSNLGKNCQIF